MVAAKDIDELELLRYIRDRQKNFDMPNPAEAWVSKGFPEKVIYSKLKKLLDRGLIDYGVSVRQCWLTPEGEAHLAKGWSGAGAQP